MGVRTTHDNFNDDGDNTNNVKDSSKLYDDKRAYNYFQDGFEKFSKESI